MKNNIQLIFLVFCGLLQACQQQSSSSADLILSNGKIYTQNKTSAWAQAVAVKDGKIIYVGDDEGALALAGPATKKRDLDGAMLMPGLNDAHVHPTTGAVKELFECNFPFSADPAQVSAAIKACVEKSGDQLWIRGGQWSSDFFIDHTIVSPREFLDRVSANKAVVLVDDAYHNVWFNTLGLKTLGLFHENASIAGGTVAKNKVDGLPNGIVIEAFGFIKNNLHWSRQQYQQAAAHAIKAANRHGITGIKGTAMTGPEIQGYQDYAMQHGPSLYMATALMTPYGHREKPLDIMPLIKLRKQYLGSHVDANFAKIFMDGVPTAARTAAMLSPYVPAKPGDNYNRGFLHVDPEILKQDVIALDKAGFTVKIHTAGDRSVRVALDAIAAARQHNGDSGLRHELAHAGFIDAADMPRFKQLNAVADLSPYIWNPSPIMDSVIGALGRARGEHYWPIKSLLESNTAVLAGSDWPAAVASINPWPGIESMVSRRDPNGVYPGALWPEQAITVQQALRIFTLDSARALRKSAQTGSIEVGKSADMILLNQNVFEVPVTAISETLVLSTWFAGRQVYSAKMESH